MPTHNNRIILTKEQLSGILSVNMDNAIALDFFLDYPNILVVALKFGSFIRYDTPLVELVHKHLPPMLSGFWNYPKSIIIMDEKDTEIISSFRYIV